MQKLTIIFRYHTSVTLFNYNVFKKAIENFMVVLATFFLH